MIVKRAPGKLYIAGEYAVIQPTYRAILIAVDRFITVFLRESPNKGMITSYGNLCLTWTRQGDKIIIEGQEKNFSYVMAGINIVESYVREKGIKAAYYDLEIVSELESSGGKKYGLGSSAAVTVATIEAICSYYKISLTKEKLFKLSSLAHLSLKSNGSCGDLAASVYGGWIAFSTFNREWLLQQWSKKSIGRLINMKWKDLSIEKLNPPQGLEIAVAWTGSPSSTRNLVDKLNDSKVENRVIYEKFMGDSRTAVEKMIFAFREKNIEEFQKQIQINREILRDLSKDLNISIETPLLRDLVDIGLRYKAYGKLSGAGGGDCGFIILKDDVNLKVITREWEKSGITYLPLKVYEREGDNIDF